MPRQTEFGCCLWLELDGKRIAFTGDNPFGNPSDRQPDGHEAVVVRNSEIFEVGFQVKLTVDHAAVPRGVQIVPFDITLNGKSCGELFGEAKGVRTRFEKRVLTPFPVPTFIATESMVTQRGPGGRCSRR